MTWFISLLTSKLMRWLFPVLLLLGAILCFSLGMQESKKIQTTSKSAEQACEEILGKYDPELAQKIREKFPQLDKATAATLIVRDKQGTEGLKKLAEQSQQALDWQLATLATNPDLFSGDCETQREQFLTLHMLAMEKTQRIADDSKDSNLILASQQYNEQYMNLLNEAKSKPDDWNRIRTNPIYAFLLLQSKQDLQQHPDHNQWPALLQFYSDEADWLDDVVTSVILGSATIVNSDTIDVEGGKLASNTEAEPISAYEILSLVKKYNPYFKNVINAYLTDDECDVDYAVAIVYSIFNNFGDVIVECERSQTTTVEDAFEMIFANQAYFFDKYQTNSQSDMAAMTQKLKEWKRSMPDAWEASKNYMNIVNLMEDVPQIANSIARKHAKDDVGTLIYTYYPEAVAQAANSIDKFGDLALAVLYHYNESDLFHKHIANNDIGARIIPYVCRFEDKGLEDVQKNKAWLNKYFDEDGKPIQDEWWVALPGGGLAKVAKNWAKGVPNTWGEIGWAALDAGDAVLIACTLGGSSVVTESGKATVKVAVKKTTQQMVKEGVIQTVKTGTERKVRSGFLKNTLRTVAKIPGGKATWRFVRGTGGRIAMFAGRIAEFGKPVVRFSVNAVRTGYKTVSGAWKSLPVNVRKGVYKTVLCVSLVYTVLYKTLPAMPAMTSAIGEEIGSLPRQIVQNIGDSTGALLAGAIKGLIGDPGLGPGWNIQAIIVTILFFVGAIICFTFSAKSSYTLCFGRA